MNIQQEKERIYKAFSDYYGNPYFVKGKEVNNYSLYYARKECLLCIDNQFLIVVVNRDYNSIGESERLSNLKWVSFQTRTMEKAPVSLKSHDVKSILNNDINEKITLVEKTQDRCVYQPDYSPLKIELMFDEDYSNYSGTGTIKSSLETYNCVITFLI